MHILNPENFFKLVEQLNYSGPLSSSCRAANLPYGTVTNWLQLGRRHTRFSIHKALADYLFAYKLRDAETMRDIAEKVRAGTLENFKKSAPLVGDIEHEESLTMPVKKIYVVEWTNGKAHKEFFLNESLAKRYKDTAVQVLDNKEIVVSLNTYNIHMAE